MLMMTDLFGGWNSIGEEKLNACELLSMVFRFLFILFLKNMYTLHITDYVKNIYKFQFIITLSWYSLVIFLIYSFYKKNYPIFFFKFHYITNIRISMDKVAEALQTAYSDLVQSEFWKETKK